jgi:hypothetical protein
MVDEAAESALEGRKGHNPPYVAYKTFKNFTDSLRIAMPSRIDRSVMHTMSGAAQSHVMSALRSMDFVTKQGLTTDAFREFVISEGDGRRVALTSAIRTGFPFLFDGSIDLSSATGKQLLEKFDATSLNGNTLRRSVAFFLAAAKDAGIAVSPYFNKIQARSASPRRVANGLPLPTLTGADEELEEEVEENTKTPPPVPPVAGESLTVVLKSGGTITLTACTSFIKMSSDDRTFVFDIIDRLQKYGAAT